jgi:GT2 family glycosyltransferase
VVKNVRIVQKIYELLQKNEMEFIHALYMELLSRPPIEAEITPLQLESKKNKMSMIYTTFRSEECMNWLNRPLKKIDQPNPTVINIIHSFFQANETVFVEMLYRELLYREPDVGGLRSLVEFLTGGGSRIAAFFSVLQSPECESLILSANPPWLKPIDSEKVSFIIPSFNQVELVKQCVKSLKETVTNVPYEIIIVDDGSKNEIQQQLKQWGNKENLHIILKPQNSGFSCTVNEGLKYACGKYIVLVNNDIIFHDNNWLSQMIQTIQSSPNIGIVGGRLLYPDNTIQHGGMCRVNNYFTHKFRYYPADFPEAQKIEDNCTVTGALFMIHHNVINDIGYFSEDYFTGYEDLDYCFRARLKGWRVVYCGKACAIHLEGKTRGAKVRTSYYANKELEARRQFEMKWSGYYIFL